MTVLFAFILFLPLLYFWLRGHWFVRVLAFLALALAFGFLGGMMTGLDARPGSGDNHAWLGILLGLAIAWPVSGIPLYARRWRQA